MTPCCARCKKKFTFSLEAKQGGYLCDRCMEHVCQECAGLVATEIGGNAKVMCKYCRAELALTGQPLKEVQKVQRKEDE
jgi:DNA-directed RNA polymerase subunit RPC12/RpoP